MTNQKDELERVNMRISALTERASDLVKHQKININKLRRIQQILNSNLGILNQIINFLSIVENFLENKKLININKIKFFINSFIEKLNNVYQFNNKKIDKIILKLIDIVESKKNIKIKTISNIKNKLKTILNAQSKKYASNLIKLI